MSLSPSSGRNTASWPRNLGGTDQNESSTSHDASDIFECLTLDFGLMKQYIGGNVCQLVMNLLGRGMWCIFKILLQTRAVKLYFNIF
jgi:hypothetical protein